MGTIVRMIIGPLFWITATYLAVTYGPSLVSKRSITPSVTAPGALTDHPVLGSESSSVQPTPAAGRLPANLLADPDKTAQAIKDLLDQTTTSVLQKGTTQVEQSREALVTSVCTQIISEVQKQCTSSSGGEQ